jgi:hypothetical protein
MLVIESVIVIAITVFAVVAMINVKDWVNRSEAMRAMRQLGKEVLKWRQQYSEAHPEERRLAPPEPWVERQREYLPGNVRLGRLTYRARYIDSESTLDEILAYTSRNYRSPLVGKGYIVLFLDGRIEWVSKDEFKKLLAKQRSNSPQEQRMLKQN